MQITINISRSKVYDLVAQESVYLAGRSLSADEQTYDKLVITDDDRQYLDAMYRDAVSSLLVLLSEYAESATEQSVNPSQRDDTQIALTLTDNVSDAGLATLQSDCTDYVVVCILADYLSRLSAEVCKFYVEQGDGLTQAIVSKLSERKRVKYAEKVAERRAI